MKYDNDRFLDEMWKWTIVPLMMTFFVAGSVVVFAVASYLLGNDRAFVGDTFKFCLLLSAFCVPFYVFLRIIRAILRFLTGYGVRS